MRRGMRIGLAVLAVDGLLLLFELLPGLVRVKHVIFWFLFDMMTLFAGFYARIAFSNIEPTMAYPLLGQLVLPSFFNQSRKLSGKRMNSRRRQWAKLLPEFFGAD